MGGRGSGRERRLKADDALHPYQREALDEVLRRIPRENLVTGRWKVYQERSGRNGGTLDAYIGQFEYEGGQDLEEEVASRFSEPYGGGTFKLRFYDAERRRVEAVPPIQLILPGDPRGAQGAGGSVQAAGAVDAAHEEEKRERELAARYRNAMLEKKLAQLEKEGVQDDPMKGALAELIRSKIADKTGGGGWKDLLELKMVMNAMRDDEPRRESEVDKAMGGIMTAVTGLVQAQAAMGTQHMQALNQLVTNSVNIMGSMSAFGQQDPWIALIERGPDLLDRFADLVSRTVHEVKEGVMDLRSEEAARALEGQVPTNGARPKIPQKGQAGARPGGRGNEFIKVVYANFQHQVPAEITADQVQYYLQPLQLQAVVSAPAEQVLTFLEEQGLRSSFQKVEGLRPYVLEVIREIQKIAQEAAEEASKEKPTGNGEPAEEARA